MLKKLFSVWGILFLLNSNAQIIYNDIDDVVLTITEDFAGSQEYLADINDDGFVDFHIRINNIPFATTQQAELIAGAVPTANRIYSPAFAGAPAPFDLGDDFFGDHTGFTFPSANLSSNQQFFEHSDDDGAFVDGFWFPGSMGQEGYLCFQFQSGSFGSGPVGYGWMLIDIVNVDTLIIKSWAYQIPMGGEDVLVAGQHECEDPTTLGTSDITTTSANLSWTETTPPTEWEIEYGISGFALGTGTTVTTTNNPYELSGLDPETSYDFYVRGLCDFDFVVEESEWVGPETFTTNPIPCAIPTAPLVTSITHESAMYEWTAGDTETEWAIEYGLDGFVPGTGTTAISAATDFELTGLDAETEYDVYVRAICEPGDTSEYSAITTFTTIVTPCFDPEDVNALTVAYNTAEIGWTDLNGALVWQYEYGLSGFTLGTGTSALTPLNPTVISDLDPSTAYDVYVRAICSEGDTSGYSSSFTFTTEEAPCMAPIDLTVVTTTENTAEIGWTELNGSTEWQIEFGPIGFDLGTGTLESITTNPNTISSLDASTAYEVYVRSICDGFLGPWSIAIAFETTEAPCVTPTDLSSTVTSPFSASVGWIENGDAIVWEIQYGEDGFALGSGTTISAATNPFELTSLIDNTTYDFYVRAICLDGAAMSDWSDSDSFTTTVDNVGVEELNQFKISVYPNPATDQLSFKLNDLGNVDIVITNLAGEVIFTKSDINQTIFNHDVSLYESGMYFYQVRLEGVISRGSFVVK